MSAARRTLVVLGTLVMAYAAAGVAAEAGPGVPVFLAAVLAAHDGVLLPLVAGTGALVCRFVPVGARACVRTALLVSLAVTVVAFPLVLGAGRPADNPSVLPLHYGRGLLEIYGVVWTTAAVAIVVGNRRRARARDRDRDRDRDRG